MFLVMTRGLKLTLSFQATLLRPIKISWVYLHNIDLRPINYGMFTLCITCKRSKRSKIPKRVAGIKYSYRGPFSQIHWVENRSNHPLMQDLQP